MIVTCAGVLLIVVVLWDAFETILLPRHIHRRFSLTQILVRGSWRLWSTAGRRISARRPRENFLGLFAMLTMLLLFGVWAIGLIFGFALLHWAHGSTLVVTSGHAGFATDVYMSGTTFFTLGLGDVSPSGRLTRALTVIEAGMGFGFLALVIAYLPVLYQSFSRREATITMMDEYAGSPPSAVELLKRCAESGDPSVIVPFLRDWELRAAQLMESQISYPILAWFRSQHDNQSWLSSLTTVLDACALVIVGVDGVPPWQARLTFAMARHTMVDLSQVLRRRPRPFAAERLPHEQFERVRQALADAGTPLAADPDAERKLAELRGMYEPYVSALSEYLLMPVPSWFAEPGRKHNWQTTAWARTGQGEAH